MGQYFKINIPEPCHEDWNKMTPNEKGAFCGSCQKTVVDFSKMDNAQIKDYFLNRSSEKTCGRFQSNQLDKPIPISVPARELSKVHLRPFAKFAAALFFVFGTSLFSCTTITGQTVGEAIIQDVEVSAISNTQDNELEVGKVVLIDSLLDEPEIKQGEIAPIWGDTIYYEGDVELTEIVDTVDEYQLIRPELVSGNINVNSCGPIVQEREETTLHMLGGMRMIETEEDTMKIEEDTILQRQIEEPVQFIDEKELTAMIYPNPAKHYFQLEFEIPDSDRYKIQLHSVDGKLIQKVRNRRYEEGVYVEQVDVLELPDGVYFCSISSEKYSHSKKVIISK